MSDLSDVPLLSWHVRTAIRYLDDSVKRDWKNELFMKWHGNLWSVGLAIIFLCVSFGCTMVSSPTAYDIFYSSAWFSTLLACALVEIVWLAQKNSTAQKYTYLLSILQSVEADATDEEMVAMHHAWKSIERIRRLIWGSYTVVSAVACLTPIADSRLPQSLRGQPTSNTWIICLQLIQCILVPPLAISNSHVIELIVTNVLCFEAVFLVLAERLRNVQTDQDLRRLIKPQSALRESCNQIQEDFERWTFLLYSLLFSTSIFGTLSLNSGVLNFELASFLVSQIFFFISLSVLGDKLEKSTEQFLDIAYFTPWLTASIHYRKMIVLLILSAQRPAKFRCGIFGILRFPTALRQFNTWYKFLQFLRKT